MKIEITYGLANKTDLRLIFFISLTKLLKIKFELISKSYVDMYPDENSKKG